MEENSVSIWIEKFNQWNSIVRKGCGAAAGPGGILCIWIGRNCSYNDCPRRNLEEIYVKSVNDDLEQTVEELRAEVGKLKEQLRLLEPETVIEHKSEIN